ncbi:hypothetical protein BaRGS_00010500, partial [Batillaria attramentaria]
VFRVLVLLAEVRSSLLDRLVVAGRCLFIYSTQVSQSTRWAGRDNACSQLLDGLVGGAGTVANM